MVFACDAQRTARSDLALSVSSKVANVSFKNLTSSEMWSLSLPGVVSCLEHVDGEASHQGGKDFVKLLEVVQAV